MGYQPADFQAFGIPMEQRVGRLTEGIEIIRRCWTGEPFSFHGEQFNLEGLQVRPAPFQKPAPPLWIGAGTRRGARRAGEVGDAYVTTPSAGLDTTLGLVNTYRQAAVAAGRQPQVVLMRDA